MSVIANDQKFGAEIYRMASEHAATEQGEKELKGFSKDQFLAFLKVFTDGIDASPREYNIHNLYLALNYVGSVVVGVMEERKRQLMQETGGNA